MSNKLKMLLLLCLNIVVVVSTTFFIAQATLLNKADHLDDNHLMQGLTRSFSTLEDAYKDLGRMAADWGEWDDTYEFMADLNEDYRDTNLTVEAFKIIDVDEVIYVNTEKQVVASHHFDFANEEVQPLSLDLEQELTESKLLEFNPEERRQGIIFLENRQVLIAANPILTSLSEGPSHGLIIMVRNLDSERMGNLSRILNHELTLLPLKEDQLPADVYYKITSLKDRFVIVHRNKEMNLGYSPLNDIYGKTSGATQVGMEREIRKGMFISIEYFIGLVLVTNVLLIIMSYSLLKKLGSK